MAQLNRPRKHVLFSDPIFDFCQIGPQVLYGSTAAVCLQCAFGFGSRQVDLGFKDFRVCYSKITWINNLEMIPLFRQPRVGSFRLFGSHRGREFAQITSIGSNPTWSANLVERRRARVDIRGKAMASDFVDTTITRELSFKLADSVAGRLDTRTKKSILPLGRDPKSEILDHEKLAEGTEAHRRNRWYLLFG